MTGVAGISHLTHSSLESLEITRLRSRGHRCRFDLQVIGVPLELVVLKPDVVFGAGVAPFTAFDKPFSWQLAEQLHCFGILGHLLGIERPVTIHGLHHPIDIGRH